MSVGCKRSILATIAFVWIALPVSARPPEVDAAPRFRLQLDESHLALLSNEMLSTAFLTPQEPPGAPLQPPRYPPKPKYYSTEWEADSYWGPKLFRPKIRIYFDTGSDDPDEIDIFDDGAATLAVNIVEFRWDFSYRRYVYEESEPGVAKWRMKGDDPEIDLSPWHWGLALGVGIGAPADNSADGTKDASDAPILLLSAGLYLEFDLGEPEAAKGFDDWQQMGRGFGFARTGPSLTLEAGYALGISSDEDISDITDGAVYVGIGIHVPF